MEKKFRDLDFSAIAGKTVILDIDGTLVPDGEAVMDQATAAKLVELKSTSKVYFCSNKRIHDRDAALSSRFGIPVLRGRRKPFADAARALPDEERKNLAVVGDKFLTDGLLARNLGAVFVKVGRILSEKDARSARLYYLIDDIAYACYKFLT